MISKGVPIKDMYVVKHWKMQIFDLNLQMEDGAKITKDQNFWNLDNLRFREKTQDIQFFL